MRIVKDFMCMMRDGIRLATDLYLPEEEGRYPLVLMRTPYDKNGILGDPLYGDLARFTDAGFVVAIQDCRGTCGSEGVLDQNGGNETKDGSDAVEYLAAQPFCNGNVGMFGLSYFGFTQLAAANGAPPHLKAICPFMCCSLASFGTSTMQVVKTGHLAWAYGQVLEHAETYIPDPELRERLLPVLKDYAGRLGELGKTLPMDANPAAQIREVPMLGDYLKLVKGVESKEFWDSIDSPVDHDRLHTAIFYATGWMDGACQSTLDNYMASRSSSDTWTREHARLLVGPWTHGGDLPYLIEGVDYGADNSGKAQDVTGEILRFLSYYLKEADAPAKGTGPEPDGNGKTAPLEGPRVRYFVMGSNEWKTSPDWPPVGSKRRLYLSGNGRLEDKAPEADSISMTYDPADPAPSHFKDSKGRFLMPDWSEISGRKDILEFLSEPLQESVTVAGIITCHLKAAADVPDTDFACRLTDTAPDGSMRQIGAGLVRARHRNGLFTCDFLTPGEPVPFRIQVGHAAWQMEKGHRFGVQLMGSLYPDNNRNLNTKEAPSLGSTFVTAHDTIFLGEESYVEIPVL